MIFLSACNSGEQFSSTSEHSSPERLYVKQLDQNKVKRKNKKPNTNNSTDNNDNNTDNNDSSDNNNGSDNGNNGNNGNNNKPLNPNYLHINNTYPAAGEEEAFINGSIRLAFTENLVKSTVKKEQFQFTTADGDDILFDLDIVANRVYLVSKDANLNCGKSYLIRVSPGMKGLSGKGLQKDFRLAFKTMMLMIC